MTTNTDQKERVLLRLNGVNLAPFKSLIFELGSLIYPSDFMVDFVWTESSLRLGEPDGHDGSITLNLPYDKFCRERKFDPNTFRLKGINEYLRRFPPFLRKQIKFYFKDNRPLMVSEMSIREWKRELMGIRPSTTTSLEFTDQGHGQMIFHESNGVQVIKELPTTNFTERLPPTISWAQHIRDIHDITFETLSKGNNVFHRYPKNTPIKVSRDQSQIKFQMNNLRDAIKTTIIIPCPPDQKPFSLTFRMKFLDFKISRIGINLEHQVIAVFYKMGIITYCDKYDFEDIH